MINKAKPKSNMTVLAVALSNARVKKGLCQREVAERCGINRSNLAAYETGRVIPPINDLINMADYYDVSLDKLVGRETQKLDDGGESAS